MSELIKCLPSLLLPPAPTPLVCSFCSLLCCFSCSTPCLFLTRHKIYVKFVMLVIPTLRIMSVSWLYCFGVHASTCCKLWRAEFPRNFKDIFQGISGERRSEEGGGRRGGRKEPLANMTASCSMFPPFFRPEIHGLHLHFSTLLLTLLLLMTLLLPTCICYIQFFIHSTLCIRLLQTCCSPCCC